MSETVLPQLAEILSDLTAQESAVATQLADIQAKLAAVQAVIPLFNVSAVSASQPPVSAKSSVEKKAEATKKPATAKKAQPSSAAVGKKKRSKMSTTTKAKHQKKDGRTATWQKYARPGVSDQPMPEAVRLILATKPKKDFKIAEVMSGLFEDKMPKAQYLKARNRISNILSGGVRSGEWYKGERGACSDPQI